MNSLILKLYFEFLRIGMFSIGGGYAVIPLIKSRVVDFCHWLSPRQFSDIITISQMTPGPIAVNTSTFVGLKIGGLFGAIAATIGCVLPGFVISLLMLGFFDRYKQSLLAAEILKGLKAVSLGLIIAAAATLIVMAFSSDRQSQPAALAAVLPPCVFGINLFAAALFLLSLFAIRRLRLNPMLVMVMTGAAGYFLYQ